MANGRVTRGANTDDAVWQPWYTTDLHRVTLSMPTLKGQDKKKRKGGPNRGRSTIASASPFHSANHTHTHTPCNCIFRVSIEVTFPSVAVNDKLHQRLCIYIRNSCSLFFLVLAFECCWPFWSGWKAYTGVGDWKSRSETIVLYRLQKRRNVCYNSISKAKLQRASVGIECHSSACLSISCFNQSVVVAISSFPLCSRAAYGPNQVRHGENQSTDGAYQPLRFASSQQHF